MASSEHFRLVGPPIISHFRTSTTTVSAAGSDNIDTNSSDSDSETLHWRHVFKPLLGFTENRSLTYVATGNPCLDFFFHVVPSTPSLSLIHRLDLAWRFDPITALKLICNLRGVRGTGKSDKQSFYTAALWLHDFHPQTLARNVRVFAEFGYFKDVLEILYRLLEGEHVRKHQKTDLVQRKKRMKISRRNQRAAARAFVRYAPSEKRGSAEYLSDLMVAQENARSVRRERDLSKAQVAYERYNHDPYFRFLHDSISKMFAKLLLADMKFLNSGELSKISLASKWCPSIDSSYDKSTLICESIAKRVFPRKSFPEYQGIDEERHYAYKVRVRLRKEVLVPLRKALELPELYMTQNQWHLLPYNRVPSVAMKNYKNQFLSHDYERFTSYLDSVKRGESKISAGALFPHEIIASLTDPDGGKVAELQWEAMVNDLKKKGKLSNCIAVCDVSGSMTGEPMEVCVSLGLLISELSEDPWKGKVITFSSSPQLHTIQGDSLFSKTEFVRQMDWGSHTDFQAVFDRILKVAVAGKLGEDEMIKKVFVFSDMEFDRSIGHHHCYHRYCFDSSSDSDSESDSYYQYYVDPDMWSVDQCDDFRKFEASWSKEIREGWGHWGSDFRVMPRKCDLRKLEAKCSGALEIEETAPFDIEEYNKREFERKQKSKARRIKRIREIWGTDYRILREKFQENGYKVPQIVFWNLRHSKSIPVDCNESGVALVSGFSKNMVKLFLNNGGIINPEAVMEQAITGDLYEQLVVYD